MCVNSCWLWKRESVTQERLLSGCIISRERDGGEAISTAYSYQIAGLKACMATCLPRVSISCLSFYAWNGSCWMLLSNQICELEWHEVKWVEEIIKCGSKLLGITFNMWLVFYRQNSICLWANAAPSRKSNYYLPYWQDVMALGF